MGCHKALSSLVAVRPVNELEGHPQLRAWSFCNFGGMYRDYNWTLKLWLRSAIAEMTTASGISILHEDSK